MGGMFQIDGPTARWEAIIRINDMLGNLRTRDRGGVFYAIGYAKAALGVKRRKDLTPIFPVFDYDIDLEWTAPENSSFFRVTVEIDYITGIAYLDLSYHAGLAFEETLLVGIKSNGDMWISGRTIKGSS